MILLADLQLDLVLLLEYYSRLSFYRLQRLLIRKFLKCTTVELKKEFVNGVVQKFNQKHLLQIKDGLLRKNRNSNLSTLVSISWSPSNYCQKLHFCCIRVKGQAQES